MHKIQMYYKLWREFWDSPPTKKGYDQVQNLEIFSLQLSDTSMDSFLVH